MRKILLLCMLILFTSSCAYAKNYVEGDAIVVFKAPENEGVMASAFASVSSIVKSCGAEVKTTYETLSEIDNKIFVHVHSNTKTTSELIAEFQKRDDVLAASPNKKFHISEKYPNDMYYNRLWGLEKINAPKVWDVTTGSENIYVGVLDSGCYMHEDLTANIAAEYGRNFVSDDVAWYRDENGHGTHVAGTIGAVGNNNIGVTGVNWNVKIIPIRVGNAKGDVFDDAIAAGLDYLAGLLRDNPNMKIAAVNMSFGDYVNYSPSQSITQDANYSIFKAFDNLNRSIIVAGAGNEGIEVSSPALFTQPEIEWKDMARLEKPEFEKGNYSYPASYPDLNNFIVVSAISSNDEAASFTCWGENVHISAPGDEIFSTWSIYDSSNLGEETLYKFDSGTSMAAPHVTGAIALLASKYPNATPAQIKSAIIEGANSNINPFVYPYKYKCKEYIDTLAERAFEFADSLESRDQIFTEITEKVETDMKDFEQFDGKGKLSKNGLLDVSASLEKLDKIMADSDSNSNSTPQFYSSSSSGCNAGFAGILIFAGVILFARKK